MSRKPDSPWNDPMFVFVFIFGSALLGGFLAYSVMMILIAAYTS